MMPRCAPVVFLFSTAALVATVRSAAVAAGPTVDAPVPPLNAQVMQADGRFEDANLTAAIGAKPAVLLFVNARRWDRPVARFVKTLDTKLREFSATAEVKMVWPVEDVEATRDYLPRAARSLQLQHTASAVLRDDGSGPAGWNLTTDATLTAVVVHRGKTSAVRVFDSINETDVDGVGELLRQALD